MVLPQKRPRNRFVATVRKLYNPIGFTQGYNFILWFIFSGAMLGFCLARIMYLDFDGVFCSPIPGPNHAAIGECYWYTAYTVYRIGIKLHLYTIIPAGILACVQFAPFIRHRFILLHRVNGYVTVVLGLIGTVGAIMIAPVAFGGGLPVQGAVGVLAIMFVGALGLAYVYVKRLRIDQHRAWMLRAWFYAGSIITVRIIMSLAAGIISDGSKPYFESKLCHELVTYLGETMMLQTYPDCVNRDAWVLVKADLNSTGPEQLSAAFDVSFGMATWISLAIHAIGVEFYLQLTPGETLRLRKISYQRQVDAGFKNPQKPLIQVDSIGEAERCVPHDDVDVGVGRSGTELRSKVSSGGSSH